MTGKRHDGGGERKKDFADGHERRRRDGRRDKVASPFQRSAQPAVRPSRGEDMSAAKTEFKKSGARRFFRALEKSGVRRFFRASGGYVFFTEYTVRSGHRFSGRPLSLAPAVKV